MPTAAEILAELEALGTEQNRKIYRRHGYAEPLFGVSFANLGLLTKRIKRDQPLAQELWDSRAHEAQVLATAIADAATFEIASLQAWAESAVDYATADAFAKQITIHTPHVQELAIRWVADERPLLKRAGWATVGCLAIWRNDVEDAFFEAKLPLIEAGIHASPSRVRESMNSALIAIGSRNERLRGPATEAARRIGKVKVDHGETNCKTPDAASYIEKTFARRDARGAM